jgi:TRAP-type mannitol/chloroaromatic compound transport system permease large subunit
MGTGWGNIFKYICRIFGALAGSLMVLGAILTGLEIGDYFFAIGSVLCALLMAVAGILQWRREKKQALMAFIMAVALLVGSVAFSFFGPHRLWLFLVAVVLLAAFEVFRWFLEKRRL